MKDASESKANSKKLVQKRKTVAKFGSNFQSTHELNNDPSGMPMPEIMEDENVEEKNAEPASLPKAVPPPPPPRSVPEAQEAGERRCGEHRGE